MKNRLYTCTANDVIGEYDIKLENESIKASKKPFITNVININIEVKDDTNMEKLKENIKVLEGFLYGD